MKRLITLLCLAPVISFADPQEEEEREFALTTEMCIRDSSGVALNGPEDDADGDGIKNVLEFVFGTRPRTRDALPPIGTAMVGGSIQLTILRRLDRAASLSLETSTGLSGWGPATSGVTVVSNGADARILSVAVGSDSRRFFRVVVTASP